VLEVRTLQKISFIPSFLANRHRYKVDSNSQVEYKKTVSSFNSNFEKNAFTAVHSKTNGGLTI